MTSDNRALLQQNRLLASLPVETLERLAPHLQPVDLIYRDILFRPDEPTPALYFPLSGIVSLVTSTSEGVALETGVVGCEGLTPIVVYLGSKTATQRGVIQAPGQALQIPAATLQEQAQEDRSLQELLQVYTAAVLIQTTKVAVCNGLHSVEERLARWLLLAHDRFAEDKLPMTQEFLGLMLGVRRASVTMAAAILQQTGFIRSHYGTVEILDHSGLEAASCDCYAVMQRATEDVFAGAT